MLERIRKGLKNARQGAKEGLLFFGKNGIESGYGIIQDSQGCWIDSEPKEGPKGPYDKIFDFGNQKHTVGSIAEVKRYTRARSFSSFSLVVTGAEDSGIRQAMHDISRLVNDPGSNIDDPEHKFSYQETIMPVFEKGAVELHELLKRQGVLEDHKYVICGPLRGGEFTVSALIYNARKIGWEIPYDRIACYELKRVLMPDGQLFVGARLGYWPDSDAGTTSVVADDCIASDRSGTVSLQIGEEQALGHLAGKRLVEMSEEDRRIVLGRQKYRPPVMMVAAASQQGIMNFANKEMQIVTGEVVFGLNDSLYLMRTPEEGYRKEDFYVGDMGSWLGRLPLSENGRAPWNEVRKKLVDYWTKTDKLPRSLRTNGYSDW